MIINTSTIIITLFFCAIFLYGGLQLVRKFAYEIAIENHDAVTAMDTAAEADRIKKERAADEAAASAFAKVQPLLVAQTPKKQTIPSSSSKSPLSTPQGSPSSVGNV
uniref:Uncharacterized protein n=1 Tax=Entomoneis paludosa TaxID=265537 RepID=A0A7S2VBM6_9STRA|mmetsp:Transcript_1205/g.2645  ORF Transcript_1205/g.2645 Transcript_1205/m.2645 type:complete len:107 (+) Transcript_1205:92-412(+)|eukprot:CAMPEP_0172461164 /NCGR_PEP_ID=MMETSP1065-20121228/39573_1 /TAXON_ID=265537 /ORGANISM="Amphiprora paludosa, Strain CCMP125" /LENGTH=106 /DNA_ID=CAMNT_0013216403 /DNA_START=70 /DNA_END=390 /DNA_ORIENTATION=+